MQKTSSCVEEAQSRMFVRSVSVNIGQYCSTGTEEEEVGRKVGSAMFDPVSEKASGEGRAAMFEPELDAVSEKLSDGAAMLDTGQDVLSKEASSIHSPTRSRIPAAAFDSSNM